MLTALQGRRTFDGELSSPLPPGSEAVVSPSDVQEQRIDHAATAAPWADMEAFVAQLKQAPPPPPAWAHSPCDVAIEETYSFETCEAPTAPEDGSTAYVRGPRDYHPVDENDIRQGKLGDCYLLSSLAAMARNQDGRELLQRAITETTRDGERTWIVTLRVPLSAAELAQPHDGARPWKEERVEVADRFLPSSARTDMREGRAELWPKIFEAAIMKHEGGADRIGHAGHAARVLPLLTGMPATERPIGEVWSAFARGDVPVVSLGPYAKGYPPYGLVTTHAYSVDRVFVDGDGRRMVQLRNPWGTNHPEPIPVDEMAKIGLHMVVSPRPQR